MSNIIVNNGILGMLLWVFKKGMYLLLGKKRVDYMSHAGLAKVILHSIGLIAVAIMVWINFPTLNEFITDLSKGWSKTVYSDYQAFLVDLASWFGMAILIAGIVIFDRLAWVNVKGNRGAKVVFVVCAIIFNLANETLSWFSYSEKNATSFSEAVNQDSSKFNKYELKSVDNDSEIKLVTERITELKADKKEVEQSIKDAQSELNLWNKRYYSWENKRQYVTNQIEHYKGVISHLTIELGEIRDKISKNQSDKQKLIQGIKVENLDVEQSYYADLDFTKFLGGLKGIGLGFVVFLVSTGLHHIGGTKYTINFQLTEKEMNADGLIGGDDSKKKRLPKKKSSRKSLPPKSTESSNEVANGLVDFGMGLVNRTKEFVDAVKNRTNEIKTEQTKPKIESKPENKSVKNPSESGLKDESSVVRSDKSDENQTNEFGRSVAKVNESDENRTKLTQVKNELIERKKFVRSELMAKWSEHRFGKYIPHLLDIIEGEIEDSIYQFSERMARQDGIKEHFSGSSLKSFGHRLEAKYQELMKK